MSQRMARWALALGMLGAISLVEAREASAGYSELLVSIRNGNDGVVAVDPQSSTVLGTFAISGPSQGLTFGPNGNLYVASTTPDAVYQYDQKSGTQVGGGAFTSGSPLGGASGVAFGLDGGLYAAGFGSNQILRFDGTTGVFDKVFSTQVSAPYGVVFGPDGNLYVGDSSSNQIVRLNGATGAKIDNFVTSVSLNTPGQFAFGPDGNLYIASYGTNSVLQVDGASGVVLNANFISNVAGATGLAFGDDGSLYVGSFTNGTIGMYDGFTGTFEKLVATGLSGGPTFIAFSAVPEPGSMILVGLGGAGLVLLNRRKAKPART